MNFIDEALSKGLKNDDFLQAMADIYNHPKVRECLDKYPQFIRDVITIIDYDTDLSMEGLDFRDYSNEINALNRAGLKTEAELLSKVCDDNDTLNDVYDHLAINNDYDGFWDTVRAYIDNNI